MTCRSARDSQQTDLLIRKYFRKGDIYVHSDLQNSSVVIIKTGFEDENGIVAPGALSQAGIMAIATSRAWDSKQGMDSFTPVPLPCYSASLFCCFVAVLIAVTSAWWVNFSQIQRRDDGGYIVRGKKNYLPPVMLVLGYGVLWSTEDEETMERHARPLFTTTEEPLELLQEEERVEEQVDDMEEDGSESGDDASNDVQDEQDKYNLQQYGLASEDEEEEINQEIDSPPPTTAKRHLSAKQRRDLKKGKQAQQASEEDSDVDDITSNVNEMSLKSTTKSVPKVRGKRGKMKKIKEKYADQSEEERELARKLLGAKTTGAQPEKQRKEALSPVVNAPSVVKKTAPAPRPPKPVVDEPLEVFLSLIVS